jgi:hypothetical protein
MARSFKATQSRRQIVFEALSSKEHRLSDWPGFGRGLTRLNDAVAFAPVDVCAPQRLLRPKTMIPDRIRMRLRRDRPMTSITLRIPEDVVESLKTIALHKGFSSYQALLKAYVGEGLRRDEAAREPAA